MILKVLRDEYPAPEELARFKREYEMTRGLEDVEGVIQVYALEPYKSTLLMVVEDFGAESLTRLLPNRSLELAEFLRLTIRITDILGRIHQRYIMHKDINPANIVWNPTTDQLKIIDFGISTELAQEQPDIATFYHLLTRQLPFQATDAMEMVHCHLAKIPTPLCELPEVSNFNLTAKFPISPNLLASPTAKLKFSTPEEIPKILSAIIMKLLAKKAEDRYQSAYGLKPDLEYCLANLTEPALSLSKGLQDLSGFTPG